MVAVLAGGPLLVACSLVTDLDLAGDPLPPADEGGTLEAGDGPAGDGAPRVTSDGGSDSKAPCIVDDDSFCDDFETAPLQERWDERRETNGGTVSVESGALVTEIPALAGSTAALVHALRGPRTKLSCSLSLTPEIMPEARSTVFALRSQLTDAEIVEHVIQLRMRTSRTELVASWELVDGGAGSAAKDLDAFAHFAAGATRTLRIDVAYSATEPTSYKLYIDGIERYASSSPAVPPTRITATKLFVGISSTLNTTAAKLRYDDVRCVEE